MNMNTTARFLCFVLLLLVTRSPAAAQNSFTDGDAIKTFLHDNFHETNAAMVIGLVDEHGSRILAPVNWITAPARQWMGTRFFSLDR